MKKHYKMPQLPWIALQATEASFQECCLTKVIYGKSGYSIFLFTFFFHDYYYCFFNAAVDHLNSKLSRQQKLDCYKLNFSKDTDSGVTDGSLNIDGG